MNGFLVRRMRLTLMAGSSGMLGDKTQEKRKIRIQCGRPEAQLSEGICSAARRARPGRNTLVSSRPAVSGPFLCGHGMSWLCLLARWNSRQQADRRTQSDCSKVELRWTTHHHRSGCSRTYVHVDRLSRTHYALNTIGALRRRCLAQSDAHHSDSTSSGWKRALTVRAPPLEDSTLVTWIGSIEHTIATSSGCSTSHTLNISNAGYVQPHRPWMDTSSVSAARYVHAGC